MSNENNKENNETNKENETNKKKEKTKDPVFPELTLDILVGIRQLFAISIQRKAFTEEEMKSVSGVFNYYAASVEGLIHTFAKNNPEVVEKMKKDFEKNQIKEKQILESIPEEESIPEDIKNGCYGDDIQG